MRLVASGTIVLIFAISRDLASAPERRANMRRRVVVAPMVVPTPTGDIPPLSADMLGRHPFGYSGKVRVRLMRTSEIADLPAVVRAITRATGSVPGITVTPGIYPLPDSLDGKPLTIVAMRDFKEKSGAWMGTYEMGFWPAELRYVRSEAYANPEGFIEVTRENQDTYVSEHLRLRDFITHNQPHVWPKYVVLREELLDKVELVLEDLSRHGIPTSRVRVLSGFRTPAHNSSLGAESGRARDSRHQFGDAVDLIVDADGNRRMDDLNNDGRVNSADVSVIESAVERVEKKYPDLIGGLGLYHSTGPSGPFAHIDVRGSRARWNGSRSRGRSRSASSGPVRSARCLASGPSAVLCAGVR